MYQQSRYEYIFFNLFTLRLFKKNQGGKSLPYRYKGEDTDRIV